MPTLTLTLSARVDQLAELRRAQPRDERCRAARRRQQRCRRSPERDDTVVSPRIAALYHVHARASTCGATIGTGFRAPTLNELYRQFRVGTTLTLANNELGPERLVGRRARRQRDADARPARCAPPGSTIASRTRSRTSRSPRRRQRHAAAPEPRRDAHPRRADRRRVPAGIVVARRRRLRLQPRHGDREPDEPRARRQVPAAGAEAPRLGRGSSTRIRASSRSP